jgi:hypothetical protein
MTSDFGSTYAGNYITADSTIQEKKTDSWEKRRFGSDHDRPWVDNRQHSAPGPSYGTYDSSQEGFPEGSHVCRGFGK